MYLHASFQLWRRLMRSEALGVHFDLGLRAFELRQLDKVEQNRMALVMLPEGGLHCLEHLALLWRSLWLQHKQQEALAVARQIALLFPEDAEGHLELAQILTDLQQHQMAADHLGQAVQSFPEDADMWFEWGVASERAGREEDRMKAFMHVWKLESEEAPEAQFPIQAEFIDETVQAALEEVPPSLREVLGEVVVEIGDYPEEWFIVNGIADPRVLGLFLGPKRDDSTQTQIEEPALMRFFLWNLQRVSPTPEDFEYHVRMTVLHEIAHYFDMDIQEFLHKGTA